MERESNPFSIFKILAVIVIIILLKILPIPTETAQKYHEIHQAAEQKDYLAASSALASIATTLPWRNDLWELAAEYALKANSQKQSIEFYEKSLSLGAISTSGRITLGHLYLQQSEPDKAIEIWESAVSTAKNPTEILFELYKTYRLKGDIPTAVQTLKRILSQESLTNDTYQEVTKQLGLLLAASQPNSAPVYLTQAISAGPADSDDLKKLLRVIQRASHQDEPAYTLLETGRVLIEMGETDIAIFALQTAVNLRPDYAEAWAFLSEARQINDMQNGLIPPVHGYFELQKALELDPDTFAANAIAAVYWQRQGNHKNALKYLEKTNRLDPLNPAVLIDLGATWASLGDLTIAQDYYQRAVRLSPNNPVYLRALVDFCIRYQINLKETALPTARKALALSPNDPSLNDALGQVLFLLHDTVNAEFFFAKALELQDNYAPAHLHLAILYLIQERTNLAKAHIEQAIKFAKDIETKQKAENILDVYLSP